MKTKISLFLPELPQHEDGIPVSLKWKSYEIVTIFHKKEDMSDAVL